MRPRDTVINALPTAAVATTVRGLLRSVSAINDTSMHTVIQSEPASKITTRQIVLKTFTYFEAAFRI